jgi:predicted enzyme related to lactoylglutathione lyase
MPATAPSHPIDWFEIPVTDLDRAQTFYETLLGTSMRREAMGPQTRVLFDYDDAGGVGGCLLAGPAIPAPSENGTLV